MYTWGGQRIIQPINKERHQVYIRDSIETLRDLHKYTENKELLELRCLNYVPPFGLMMTDPDGFDGKIGVDIYNWRMPYGSMPAFELTRYRDESWFQFFQDQFETLWKAAEHVELGT